jgi:tol-pal system protein YbgF
MAFGSVVGSNPAFGPEFGRQAGAPVATELVTEPGTYQFAQTADATVRVNQLEEQVRALNGKIEDLNFIILQLQEQMRKMQEDIEFRFQEIEQKRGALGNRNDSVAAIRVQPQVEDNAQSQQDQGAAIGGQQEGIGNGDPPRNQGSSEAVGEQAPGVIRTIDGVEIFEGKPGQVEPGGGQVLGKMVFDANGNLVDTAIEKPLDLTQPPAAQQLDQQQAPRQQQTALVADPAKVADQAYDLGYTYVQAGDYRHAANSFREFVRDYPRHAKIAEANFWLGESLLAMRNFEDAAKVFLDTHKKYPNARLAPQTLLKLGVSLAGMNQRELACATFAEVNKKYPKASESVRTKVVSEQKAANCTAG